MGQHRLRRAALAGEETRVGVNPQLIESARLHSQWMLDNDTRSAALFSLLLPRLSPRNIGTYLLIRMFQDEATVLR
jgi:hypothetical protein